MELQADQGVKDVETTSPEERRSHFDDIEAAEAEAAAGEAPAPAVGTLPPPEAPVAGPPADHCEAQKCWSTAASRFTQGIRVEMRQRRPTLETLRHHISPRQVQHQQLQCLWS